MNSGLFDVSVLIATYNPDWKELKKTLNSILLQNEINFEIVISDDGSVDPLKEEIFKYFQDHSFDNYNCVFNEQNNGTVINICKGLKACRGTYVKLISPGDFLYGEFALKKLCNVAVNDKVSFVFGDVIYYKAGINDFNPISHSAHPQMIKPYIKRDHLDVIYNYLIMNDTIHGVSTLVERETFSEYLNSVVGRIKFAEDCVYRIMIADGIRVSYCDSDVVCYSFGEGISTTKENKWTKIIKKDLIESDIDVIRLLDHDKKTLKRFNASIAFRDCPTLINRIRFWIKSPKAFFKKLFFVTHKRNTNTTYDKGFIDRVYL